MWPKYSGNKKPDEDYSTVYLVQHKVDKGKKELKCKQPKGLSIKAQLFLWQILHFCFWRFKNPVRDATQLKYCLISMNVQLLYKYILCFCCNSNYQQTVNLNSLIFYLFFTSLRFNVIISYLTVHILCITLCITPYSLLQWPLWFWE